MWGVVAGYRCVLEVNVRCRRPVLAAWWSPRSQLGGRAPNVTADRYWKKKKHNYVCLLLFLLFPSLSDYVKHTSFTLCWDQNSYPHVQNVLWTTVMLWLDFTVCLCVSVENTLISTFQIFKKAPTEHLYPRLPDTVLLLRI